MKKDKKPNQKTVKAMHDVNKRRALIECADCEDLFEKLNINTMQKKELDKRLDSYYKNPSLGSSWSQVKKRIKSVGRQKE